MKILAGAEARPTGKIQVAGRPDTATPGEHLEIYGSS